MTVKCFRWENGAYPVTVFQTGKDMFSVAYGAQYKSGLTYHQAAQELGCNIFHALVCDGKLDNDGE